MARGGCSLRVGRSWPYYASYDAVSVQHGIIAASAAAVYPASMNDLFCHVVMRIGSNPLAEICEMYGCSDTTLLE